MKRLSFPTVNVVARILQIANSTSMHGISGRNTTEMDKLTSNKSYTTSTRMITTNARTTTESDLPIHTRPEGEQTFTAVPDLSPANNTVNYTEILIPVLVVCGAVLFLLGIISIGKKIWRAYRTRQDARRMQHVYNFGRQESGTKEADGDENNHLLDTRTNGKEQGKNEDIRILIRDEMPSTHIDKRNQTMISDNDHKPSDAELGENNDEAAHEDDKITTVSETGSNTKDLNDHYGYEGDCTNLKKVNDCHLAYIDTGQCNTTQSKTHVGFGQGVIESPRNENLACGPSPSSESPLDKAENGPQLRQYLANPTTRNGIDRNVISGHRRSTVFQPDINEQTDQKNIIMGIIRTSVFVTRNVKRSCTWEGDVLKPSWSD
ncbi:uncharacterized protein [Argopecten irradians]|uniref:uncharacterized protein isoform X2 n=1 Tax=Argopecten irradians TaxID=31199 RepID=UPI00371F6264